LDFVKEMGRTKPKTVSELMDVTNKFADGEDVYHNKRTRSLEDDRSHRYSNQWCRFCNYKNYNSHSQVAVGYKGNNNEGESVEIAGTAMIREMIRVTIGSSGQEP
jgi:hypothetical protein